MHACILSARREARLQLADFACNCRITRDSRKFDESSRNILKDIFKNAHIFSVKVSLSQKRIMSALAAGSISEALFELYTTRGDVEHKKMLSDLAYNAYKGAKVDAAQKIAEQIKQAAG